MGLNSLINSPHFMVFPGYLTECDTYFCSLFNPFRKIYRICSGSQLLAQ